MKRLLQLVISLLFFIPLAWSQPNLVPNPSFENKKKCLKTSENYNLESLNNVEKWFSLIPYWNLKYWGGIWQYGKCVGGVYGGKIRSTKYEKRTSTLRLRSVTVFNEQRSTNNDTSAPLSDRF